MKQRPRAKSEETSKFPPDLRPRARLISEGGESENRNEASPPPPDATEDKFALNAPALVKGSISQGNNDETNKKTSPQVLPPPPVGFRDPDVPFSDDTKNKSRLCPNDSNEKSSGCEESQESVIKRRTKSLQIQKSLEERMANRLSRMSATFECNVNKSLLNATNEKTTTAHVRIDEGDEVLKDKEKVAKEENVKDKKKSDTQLDYVVVERTGDYMETKSLPRSSTNNRR